MKFLQYSCFKPAQHTFSQSKGLCTWCPLFGDSLQPTQRSNHAVCVYNNRIFMYGGRSDKGTLNQFWVFDCDNLQWNELFPHGEAPPRLEGHSMVLYEEKVYIFGGETSFASADESPFWEYDIGGERWTKISTNGNVMFALNQAPCGRRQHSAVLYMGAMCVYGGYQDLIGPTKEMWLFDFETRSWHFDVAASRESAPDARYGHSAAVNNQSMWVCGGLTGLKPNSEVLSWNFELMLWTTVKTKGGPAELSGHAMCTASDVLYIFGGCDSFGEASSDTWQLSLSDCVWKKCQCADLAPPALSDHTLAMLSTPNGIKKNEQRTRSFPDVKKKRSGVKASPVKQRSLSCSKLPHDANYLNPAFTDFAEANGQSSSSDKAMLLDADRSAPAKVQYTFENPHREVLADGDVEILPGFEPILSCSRANKLSPVVSSASGTRLRPFSAASAGQKPVKQPSSYVSSRLRYGNLKAGDASVKTFSYNLMRDAFGGAEHSVTTETSSMEIPAHDIHSSVTAPMQRVIATNHNQVIQPSSVSPYPAITNVKPLEDDISADASNYKQLDVEIEPLDHKSDGAVSVVTATDNESTEAENAKNKSVAERFRVATAPSDKDEFVILVLGGKVSDLNSSTRRSFNIWQCKLAPTTR